MPNEPLVCCERAGTRKLTIETRNLSDCNIIYGPAKTGHKKIKIKLSLCLTNNPQK